MYIDTNFHGRGIGPNMVKEGIRLLGWTEKDGKMFCRVLERNYRAVKFYEKMGGCFEKMTNAQAAITIHYRPATQADAEQCARVYNEGWILAFSESGLISQDIIKRANDTRLETLQRTLPTNGGPDATGSILIVAVATVDSKDQVVGVCGLGPSREPDDVPGYPLELLNM
ncbi:hypothetical protein HDU79_001063 [Rhizoclosmatium sp. JEL0117]|nr:hypothetical protein HDU79_001063 [Rhizoclosmatium sp. JEL0117]